MNRGPICIAALLAASGAALATDPALQTPTALAPHGELFQRTIAREMLRLLPDDARSQIQAAGGIGAEPQAAPSPLLLDERYDKLSRWVTPDAYAVIDEVHLDALAACADRLAAGEVVPAFCFTDGTPLETVAAFNAMFFEQDLRFQQNSRWSSTAYSGGGLNQGDPTIISYSFVPDGTFVPDSGFGGANSALFSWLNGIYGSPAVWQPLFHGVFDRWSELCGTSYVFEPTDDGASLHGSSGSPGVRGDVRISAIPLDGNSGVLAYNFFPNTGDMVFDAFDSFYSNTNANNIRLRNVTSHEHGHGMGMNHVCPIATTKLMEPFYTGVFDGPQIDDILNGQRHYGDPNEPNDSTGAATDLGSVTVGSTVGNSVVVSLDDDSDDDYYRFSLPNPAEILITVTPQGGTYLQGPQNADGSCSAGVSTNYSAINNLAITLLDSGGSTIASANFAATGATETLSFDLFSTGTYFVRVDSSTTNNNIQAYNISIEGTGTPFGSPEINLPFGAPTQINPGTPTTFDVSVDPVDDTIVSGPSLFYRFNGGSYLSAPLTFVSGTTYTATLPAASCGDSPEFYIALEGQTAGDVFEPAPGPGAPFSAVVGNPVTAFSDNFQSNLGWTISGPVASQATGRWERGVPAGDGSRGDAPDDFDASGQCYLTGNGGPGSNTDVDGGSTILTSPLFNLSSLPESQVSYARWYDNTGSGLGANPGVEIFRVEISNNNGSTWTTLETVGPSSAESSGGWFTRSFRVADFVTPTSTVLLRFTAKDDVGAVIEAAVDAISITAVDCTDPDPCPCDLDSSGGLNLDDVTLFADAFVAFLPLADLNSDGVWNLDDVTLFAACFTNGCP